MGRGFSFMKIFGIGMNYLRHTQELDGKAYVPEEPVVFTKADSALLTGGKPFFLPDYTERCEYETELVVRINHMGRSIPERFAHRYYDHVSVGIDFTLRDVQERLRREGKPWDLCKGFDGSAVVGEFVPIEGNVQDLHFSMTKNGTVMQEGWTGDMIYSVDRLISFISRYFTLKTGDLIFTGTPVGVGPVNVDDHIEGYLEGNKILSFNVK